MKRWLGKKYIREGRKKTQAEFAELHGMSVSAYQRLERGETKVDLEMMKKIAETLQIPVQELLPELSFNNSNSNHHQQGYGYGGVIIGNLIISTHPTEVEHTLQQENSELKLKITFLEEKINLLEQTLNDFRIYLSEGKR